MLTDTVPLTLAAIFLAMLAAVWSLETLQQPYSYPTGPVTTYVGGATFTQVAPPVVNETGARISQIHADSRPQNRSGRVRMGQ